LAPLYSDRQTTLKSVSNLADRGLHTQKFHFLVLQFSMTKKILLLSTLFILSILKADTAALYKEKCANCHGADARQSALGKSGSIAGRSKQSLIKDLKAYKAGIENKNGMGGLMKAQVKSLSSKQITSLAAYISKLPR